MDRVCHTGPTRVQWRERQTKTTAAPVVAPRSRTGCQTPRPRPPAYMNADDQFSTCVNLAHTSTGGRKLRLRPPGNMDAICHTRRCVEIWMPYVTLADMCTQTVCRSEQKAEADLRKRFRGMCAHINAHQYRSHYTSTRAHTHTHTQPTQIF